jgi:cell division septation protein DedD
MKLERIVGFIFLFSLLTLLLVSLEPNSQYQEPFLTESIEVHDGKTGVKEKSVTELPEASNEIIEQVKKYEHETDFERYVVRIHVLSSKDKAESIVKNLKTNGYPAFVKVFGQTKQLNAVYAGPFISKEFLNDNIEEIYKLSEATEGELEQWKG